MAGTARSDFEYRCVRPGLWIIEGYTVTRVSRRRARWAGPAKQWLIRHPSGEQYVVSLDDAFDLIGNEMSR